MNIVVSENQKRVHVIFEFLAITLQLPWLLYLSFYVLEKNSIHKYIALILAIAVIIIDGGLLLKWVL